MGYSLWGHKESDTTERLHFHLKQRQLWTDGKSELAGGRGGGRQPQPAQRASGGSLSGWKFLDVSGLAAGKAGLGRAVKDLDCQDKALRLQPTLQHFPKCRPQNTPCLDPPR